MAPHQYALPVTQILGSIRWGNAKIVVILIAKFALIIMLSVPHASIIMDLILRAIVINVVLLRVFRAIQIFQFVKCVIPLKVPLLTD